MHEQRGVTVSTLERVDLRDIRLAVGEVTTTVEVQALNVNVQTTSSDRGVSLARQ
ncbi:MAG: hypothetical protein JJE04_08440 [Acidobacteriia bacterium]|nr:hypothetical protein [Terriglobia bacterium]